MSTSSTTRNGRGPVWSWLAMFLVVLSALAAPGALAAWSSWQGSAGLMVLVMLTGILLMLGFDRRGTPPSSA